MKLKELYELLDTTSKIELKSYWGEKYLLGAYANKFEIEKTYFDTEVKEISQSNNMIVLYLNRTERVNG